MQVEALDCSLERQIDDVVGALAGYHGHRSVWIDPFGALWHAEPEDDQLDALGHRYIGTFLRPDKDALREALVGFALPKLACLSVQPREQVKRATRSYAAAV
jgi:hypothetical protein